MDTKKKNYETPYAEKIEFNYEEQVVAVSNDPIGNFYIRGSSNCNCGE